MQTNWKSTSQITNIDKNIFKTNNSSKNFLNPEVIEMKNLKKNIEEVEKFLIQVSF